MANNTTNKLSILLDASVFGTTGTAKQVVSSSGAALGGSGSSASSGVTDQLSRLAEQMQQLQTVSQSETETVLANTQAVTQNTTQLGSSGPSTASKVGSTLESKLGLGLGLSPLITGLLSLFGGGGSGSQAVAPTPFALPPSVSVNAGVSEGAPTDAFGLTYMAGGLPRAESSPAGGASRITSNNTLNNLSGNVANSDVTNSSLTNNLSNNPGNNPASAPAATTQITVQVQAMDSRSFLDHSNDIALAVRQAMLQSSVLNDVIREV
jgi:hypothetical protein